MKKFDFLRPMALGLMVMTAVSCSKQDDGLNGVTDPQMGKSEVFQNPGKAHNDMLDIFYGKVGERKEGNTLEDKIAIVDGYFAENNVPFTFSMFVDTIPELYDFLALVHSSDLSLADYADLFAQYRVEGWSTEKELEYQLIVIDSIAADADIDVTIRGIENIKQMVMVDELLTAVQKSNMIDALDISIASMEYWNTEAKGLPWYTRDVMGALYAWNSGMAGWATLVTGGNPAAGGAVVVGVAAVSSMLR